MTTFRAVLVGVTTAVAALALVGLWLVPVVPPLYAVLLWCGMLLVGLLLERSRYKPIGAAPPGPGWQHTGERFVDPESGRLVGVQFDPRTGERRYVAESGPGETVRS